MDFFVQPTKHRADGNVDERKFSPAEDRKRQAFDKLAALQPGNDIDIAYTKPLMFNGLYKEPWFRSSMLNDLYKKLSSNPLMFNDLYLQQNQKDRHGRDDATGRPLQKFMWIEALHPRNAKGEFIAVLTGAVEGVRDGLADTLDGLATLAEAGHSLFTDPQAWANAWETSKHAAEAVYDYGTAVTEDPVKPFRDVGDGVSSAFSAFGEAYVQAVKDGREAEFWGKVLGRGAFEFYDPFGKAGKAAKATVLGMTAKTAEEAVNAGRAAHGAEAAGQLASRSAAELRASNIAAAKKKSRFRDNLDDKFFDREGRLIWPDDDGFAHPRYHKKLFKNDMIDRYSPVEGPEDGGKFLAPDGTPYEARSLPYDREKMIYTRYRVLKDFDIEAGLTAPAFGQVGGGMQYFSETSVQQLIHDRIIEEIK